jgi:hypothetical protein
MRPIILATAFLMAGRCFAATPVLMLSSDQISYSARAVAKLSAIALVPAGNSQQDFFLGATLNGAPLNMVQTSKGAGLATTDPLVRGTFTFSAQLFLEDSVFAGQLNSTISNLALQNGQLSTQLSQTSDPVQLAAIHSQIDQNNKIIQEANNQLTLIRTPFGASQSLNFSVN